MKTPQNIKQHNINKLTHLLIFTIILPLGALCWLSGVEAKAQNIGINSTGNNAHPSAILDVDAAPANNAGLLIPRLTLTQRNAITSPAISLLIYNITNDCLEMYSATSGWISIGCGCQLPGTFSALSATGIGTSSFVANWSASAGANNYLMDVSTTSSFTTFVAGYNNLSVGNNLSNSITGLTCGTIYYYRIRANNACGTSANSNVITTTVAASSSTITQVFNYTGTDQVYTIPSCATFVTIKAWGAAGGEWVTTAGAGGYTSATFNLGSSILTPGQTISVVVGKGGNAIVNVSQPNIYGFGGGSLSATLPTNTGTGQGGGLSGVFTGNTTVLPTDMGRAIVIAGGGGGSGEDDCLSVNFRRHGGSGNDPVNGGGMATMQGIDGNSGTGCTPAGYGGGGGGYNGGTSHTRDGAGGGTYAGNGGSGFVHASASSPSILFTPEFSGTPPNTVDVNYNGIAGQNTSGNGNNGLVVIIVY